MVSIVPDNTIFDDVSKQIVDTFSGLIEQLTTRRDQLLAEVNAMRVEFENNLKTQEENLKDLERIQIQIEKINIKQDQINLVKGPIQKQISELIKPPNLKFECQPQEISDQIIALGAITSNEIPVTIDYAKKIEAMKAIRVFEINAPSYLHVDGKDLYVINNQNSIIQIVDATDWSFKKVINIEETPPICVASSGHHLYIPFQDRKNDQDRIHQLNKENLELVKTATLFKSLSGQNNSEVSMALTEEEIYVVGSNSKNKIIVFDLYLHYRREFGKLESPKCIKFNQDRLYVLDSKYSLHTFNTLGQKLGLSYEFVKLNIWGYLGKLHNVDSFCFDQTGNAIFVSPNEGRVSIIAPDGKKIFDIGKESQCTEDIGRCSSVAVFRDKIVIACTTWNSIKIF